MREIKFEYGFESVNGIVKKFYNLSEIPNIKQKCDVLDVLPIIYVRQFTGLLDKNGKEIYEGDIVFNSNKSLLTLKEDKRLYLVKWQEGEYDKENTWLMKKPSFIFEKLVYGNKKYMDLIFNQNQIEIIGNIYENPKLLNN